MNTTGANGRPHRIARFNYWPRVLGFAVNFVVVVLLYLEWSLPFITLPLAAVSFLLYPHVVYWAAARARDSKRAELLNLQFDSLLLGLWVAGLGFHTWLSFSLLLASLINSVINGGMRTLVYAFLAFVGGCALWGLIGGFYLSPDSSLTIDIIIIASILLYVVGVGLNFYHQNRKLALAHGEIAHKNRVFRYLLDMDALIGAEKGLESLIGNVLGGLRSVFRGREFGVLLFDRERRNVVHHAVFSGMDTALQNEAMHYLLDNNDQPRGLNAIDCSRHGTRLAVMPMGRRLKHFRGFLVVAARAEEEKASSEGVLQIFVDQLSGALENELLTLELRKAAETDALTGLFNRGYLESQLRYAVENKHQYEELDFSVVMIDVIGLKRINDEFGHAVGDQLIIEVARRLQAVTRKSDVLARFGGDEFVILCRGCDNRCSEQVVERTLAACHRQQWEAQLADGASRSLELEVSVGAAGSDVCDRPEDVLGLADQRMYSAKQRFYAAHNRCR